MADESVETKLAGMQVFNVLEMEHRQAATFSNVYCNTTSFGMTFYDLSIVFGQIVALDSKSMIVEDGARIVMGWEHAKALSNALLGAIAHYEKTHGPIRKAPHLDNV